ncbi:DUF3313 family protein [Echinimonas agarilytica]|uniref:DUF3313 domain-containing protein n=1 Tax=Echinimonas agarilytica TaxID=1215918 RepID=A0AA42B8A4_9GAMM|nr:DUF3313 family protein [Echinimonas agarilytica]MCM2680243.1 DUF3313 domain-containing protein [Echinimonas agarilytica]
MKSAMKTFVIAAIGIGMITLSGVINAEEADVSFDQLTRVQSDKVRGLYVKPGADFSHYDAVMLDDATVSYRKSVLRTNSSVSRSEMKRRMDRASEKLSESFGELYAEEMNELGTYKVVDAAGENVLRLSPSIINLYLANPDPMRASGNTKIYAESAGEMTLVMEVRDSQSGEILARIVDPRQATDWNRMEWQTSVTNARESRKIIKRWAKVMSEGLLESAQQPAQP